MGFSQEAPRDCAQVNMNDGADLLLLLETNSSITAS